MWLPEFHLCGPVTSNCFHLSKLLTSPPPRRSPKLFFLSAYYVPFSRQRTPNMVLCIPKSAPKLL